MEQQKESFIKNLTEKKGQIKSYVFVILSSFFWVGGYIYGNQRKFSPYQTNLSRTIIMTIGSYIICRSLDLNIQFQSPQSWRVLIKRHLAITIQGFILASVQFILPLGIVHTISGAGPIFTLMMEKIMFKTTLIKGKKLIGLILAVIGLIMTSNGKKIYSLINPQFQFQSNFNNYVSDDYLIVVIATFILLLSMILWAYGVLITKQANCHSFQIIFHFGVTNLFMSSISYLFLTQKRPALQMYQSLIWTGLLLFLAEIFFTLALNLCQNIGLTNIVAFSCSIIGYGVSIIRYGQKVDIVSISGTVLVLMGLIFVIILSQNKKQNYQQMIQVKKNQQKQQNIK